jgi:TMEM175 potassium channel family protein
MIADENVPFSKARLEMLCDGIFAIAMTLLVLELKVPDVPRTAPSIEIWHGLGERGPAFAGFALTFVLAGNFWLLHHQFFHYLRRANRPLALLTIPYLMFVSLLPFSTSMLTAFSLKSPVGLAFYFGNQCMLGLLLAIQWLVAGREGLLTAGDASKREAFGLVITLQPFSFALSFVLAFIAPGQAMTFLAITQAAIAGAARRRSNWRVPA